MKKILALLLLLSSLFASELDEGVLISYDPEEKTLDHQGETFYLMTSHTGHFSARPIVSIGIAPLSREIISLDPDNAPYLEQKYQELLSTLLWQADSAPKIFEMTAAFVRNELFSPPLCNEDVLNTFLQTWIFSPERTREEFTITNEGKLLAVIPLEDFVKARCGVCRHQAFVVGYFLDKMQNEPRLGTILPPGKTFCVREEVAVSNRPSTHAWNLFISQNRALVWHIDAMLGIVKDLQAEEAALTHYYGKKAIDKEKKLLGIND